MDSVTQFALGAGVGMVTLGPSMGARKAAITGGLLGTLPDLDVYWPFDNPVDSFILHRGPTHSLIVHALVTPLIAEPLRRVFTSLREARVRVYLAVFLCLATHALLDGITVYGTRLLWPLWPEPLALGSIFIIDPLYTLPLAAMVVWAMFVGGWTEGFQRHMRGALIISSFYLAWGVAAQGMAENRAKTVLGERGIHGGEMMAIPTPFNSLFWRVISINGPTYYNVYVPIFAGLGAVTVYAHPRWEGGTGCWAEEGFPGNEAAARLARFSQGFYRLMVKDGTVVYADLRMGITPNYAFRFAVAETGADRPTAVAVRRITGNRQAEGDMEWLQAGILGNKAARPAETAAAVIPNMVLAESAIPQASCG